MKINNKTERGQSLVELAISLVVLLYLLSGVVEFGIAFFQFIQLRDAAQEGALYGSLNPTDTSGINVRVRAASDKPIYLPNDTVGDARRVTVTITPIDSDGNGVATCIGDGIRVDVSFNHQIFMPFISRLIGANNRTPANTIPLLGSVTDTILHTTTTTGCP